MHAPFQRCSRQSKKLGMRASNRPYFWLSDWKLLPLPIARMGLLPTFFTCHEAILARVTSYEPLPTQQTPSTSTQRPPNHYFTAIASKQANLYLIVPLFSVLTNILPVVPECHFSPVSRDLSRRLRTSVRIVTHVLFPKTDKYTPGTLFPTWPGNVFPIRLNYSRKSTTTTSAATTMLA
jgi:hypothetical protein